MATYLRLLYPNFCQTCCTAMQRGMCATFCRGQLEDSMFKARPLLGRLAVAPAHDWQKSAASR
jgi:hypothetical protein